MSRRDPARRYKQRSHERSQQMGRVSLACRHDFADGFGLIANHTYSDGESDAGDPRLYHSENQYTISPFFENEHWTARVSYPCRSEYFTNVDRGDNLWTRPDELVDALLCYRFNDHFSITLDAMNLLDEAYHRYASTEVLTRGV